MQRGSNPIFGDPGLGDWDDNYENELDKAKEKKLGVQYKPSTGPRYPKGTYQTEALKRGRKRLPKESL